MQFVPLQTQTQSQKKFIRQLQQVAILLSFAIQRTNYTLVASGQLSIQFFALDYSESDLNIRILLLSSSCQLLCVGCNILSIIILAMMSVDYHLHLFTFVLYTLAYILLICHRVSSVCLIFCRQTTTAMSNCQLVFQCNKLGAI